MKTRHGKGEDRLSDSMCQRSPSIVAHCPLLLFYCSFSRHDYVTAGGIHSARAVVHFSSGRGLEDGNALHASEASAGACMAQITSMRCKISNGGESQSTRFAAQFSTLQYTTVAHQTNSFGRRERSNARCDASPSTLDLIRWWANGDTGAQLQPLSCFIWSGVP